MTHGAVPLLMTPGPTRIPGRVLRAGNRVLHHRTPEFSAALAEALERLRPWFGTTEADVLPIHATGRAGMEGAITNFFSPGDTVVACCNGKFGEMWAGLAETYGLDVRRVAVDWDRSVDPDEVGQAVLATGAAAVLVTHSDTSTGVLNPVADIARVASEGGALVLVDGISSVCGAPFHFDGWGLDFAVTSSQKCLMSSPGVAFAVVSPRLWARTVDARLPRSYLDLDRIRQSVRHSPTETPGTTPVSIVLQVLEALRMHDEEGRGRVLERHRGMAEHLRVGATKLGFGLQGGFIEGRSPTLTALEVPRGVDGSTLKRAMLDRGILIATGLGDYASRAVRIGHMGDIRLEDVDRTLDALAAAVAGSGP